MFLKELIQSLCEEVMRPDPEELGKMHNRQKVIRILRNMSSVELQKNVRELLGENKYFIIFDDI